MGSFLTSVRLAVALIGLVVVLSVCATLVPQGRPGSWYAARYSPAVAWLLRAVHLDAFFTSALFLALSAALALSLASCTARRAMRRIRERAPRRFGPDLVHLGLLVLVAAGLTTGLTRQETMFELSQGESAEIGRGYRLRLISLQYLRYEDGSPREWISTVEVARQGLETAVVPIRVNHPLRLRGLSVYQASWDARGTLLLRDLAGRDLPSPQPGDYFETADSRWVFAGFQKEGLEWTAVFVGYRGGRRSEIRGLRAGDSIGPFTVMGISAREYTGLRAVRDPGLAPFLVAMALLTGGLCLTFFQKSADLRQGEGSP